MRKRWFLLGMILLLVPWLTIGCGIAQEQYDAVVSDLTKAQQDLQSVRDELKASQAENSELTSSLEGTRGELKAAKSELEASQAKNSDLTSSLEETKTELEATKSEYESFKSEGKRLLVLLAGNLGLNGPILGINSALLLKELGPVTERAETITSRLSDLKDLKKAELQALWEEAYTLEGGGRWTLTHRPFERFMTLNASRIAVKMKALGEHLTK